MNKHVKLFFAALTILTGSGAFFSILAHGIEPSTPVSVVSLLFIFLPFLICASLLYWSCNRRDPAPDFLSRISKNYFDQGGLCFLVAVEEIDMTCYLTVYYQNRFSRPCNAIIALHGPEEIFPGENPYLLHLKFNCAGGAFGKVAMPWGIPLTLQGTTMTFKLTADSNYPSGRGPTLRFRDGLRVGTLSGRKELMTNVLLLSAGHLFLLRRAAKLTVQFPHGVSTPDDEEVRGEIRNDTFWKLGDSPNWVMPPRPGLPV